VPAGYNSGMNCSVRTASAPAFTPRAVDRAGIEFYLRQFGAMVPLEDTHPAGDPHADAVIGALWAEAETGAYNDPEAPGAPCEPPGAWVADEAAKRVAFVLMTLTFGFQFAHEAAAAVLDRAEPAELR